MVKQKKKRKKKDPSEARARRDGSDTAGDRGAYVVACMHHRYIQSCQRAPPPPPRRPTTAPRLRRPAARLRRLDDYPLAGASLQLRCTPLHSVCATPPQAVSRPIPPGLATRCNDSDEAFLAAGGLPPVSAHLQCSAVQCSALPPSTNRKRNWPVYCRTPLSTYISYSLQHAPSPPSLRKDCFFFLSFLFFFLFLLLSVRPIPYRRGRRLAGTRMTCT